MKLEVCGRNDVWVPIHEKTAPYAFQRWLPPLVSLIGVVNYILLVFEFHKGEFPMCGS